MDSNRIFYTLRTFNFFENCDAGCHSGGAFLFVYTHLYTEAYNLTPEINLVILGIKW
jgi:hypothetical protein